jgi:tRNA A-37 threonylcarbamoyl transferase component Bud32
LSSDATSKPAANEKAGDPGSTIAIGPEAFLQTRRFGDYELQEEIAAGGMGVVWKARQAGLNRSVALKMILAGKFAGEAQVQRFRREAEAAANLQHPNIVAIHEVGEHDGQHYYSMDYIEGRDLGALVRESGPLSPARAAECLRTIAEAVHFAHQRGTLHRDLKPQNVLMDAAGVPHITDFGLAKFIERDDDLTQTGAAMGSPSYMPPEQAAGRQDQIGPQSDVYSLGAILYELLTGRPPFRAETPMATMRQVMESDPVAPHKLNPGLPPDLDTICLKCLEKNPARRYPSARALAEDLDRFLKHEPIQALPVAVLRKAESWLRRHPWTLMAAVSLAALVFTGMFYWQYERVQFLEERASPTEQALHARVLRQQFQVWDEYCAYVLLLTYLAFFLFRRFALGKAISKLLFTPPVDWAPTSPVIQPLRVLCGLISVGALGFTVIYFAKAIQVSVWENVSMPAGAWLVTYSVATVGLMLLSQVVRDYQKFVHGAPTHVLSAEQGDSLRQAIFDGDVPSAVKLYRQSVPGVPKYEAKDYVDRLAAELRAKCPEKFAPPPKPWDLNLRATGLCLLVELAAFPFCWMLPAPPSKPATALLRFAAGFVIGAGIILSSRVRPTWKRLLCQVGFCMWVPLLPTWFQMGGLYYKGVGFGGGMILSGFARRRGKTMSVPTPPSP